MPQCQDVQSLTASAPVYYLRGLGSYSTVRQAVTLSLVHKLFLWSVTLAQHTPHWLIQCSVFTQYK